MKDIDNIEFMRRTLSLCRKTFLTKPDGVYQTEEDSELVQVFDELHRKPSWSKIKLVLIDSREQFDQYIDINHPLIDEMKSAYGEVYDRLVAKDWGWFKERSVK